jgi:hypothetical protein
MAAAKAADTTATAAAGEEAYVHTKLEAFVAEYKKVHGRLDGDAGGEAQLQWLSSQLVKFALELGTPDGAAKAENRGEQVRMNGRKIIGLAPREKNADWERQVSGEGGERRSPRVDRAFHIEIVHFIRSFIYHM